MFQDDLMDTLLRYGLFLGAIFQLICIGAVVILPDYKSDYLNESESEDEPGSDQGSPTHTSSGHRHPRSSKREKKKRR